LKNKAFRLLDTYLGTIICLLLTVLKKLRGGVPAGKAEPESILVMKLVAVGDLVAALPAVRVLRRRYPEAHLALLCTPRVRDIVEGNADLDQIVYYDVLGEDAGVGGFFRLIRRLRSRREWDWVVELDQRYRLTSILAYFLRPSVHAGFAISGQGRQGLFDVKVPYRTDCHEVDSFLDVAEAMGARREDLECVPIAYSEEDRRAVDEFLARERLSASDFLVLIHPGTSGIAREREWPPARFAEVADWLVHRYGARLIFTGSGENMGVISDIRTKMTTPSSVAAGELSMKQFAALAERSRLMLSIDTGSLHVAAAMGTPVVALFGPSTPVKWGPFGSGHKVVYKRIECSPCAKPYMGRLPDCANPRCMTQIGVEQVKAALKEKIDALQVEERVE